MITIDGINYETQSAYDSALDMVNWINRYCVNNNIKNADGEIVSLDANNASVAWLIILANGYRDSYLQELLRSVAGNFNLGECSDVQLLELARICRVVRRAASRTTVMVNVEADITGDVTVTRSDIVTLVTGASTLVFSPANEFTVAAGQVGSMVFICDKAGPYPIDTNAINKFDVPIANVKTVSSQAGVAGLSEESLPELRWRMQTGRLGGSDVDNAQSAISQLGGVSYCNVFTNDDNEEDAVVNGVTIPPRKAAIFLMGYSDYVAKTYYDYMTMTTVSDKYEGRKASIIVRGHNGGGSSVIIPKGDYLWSNGDKVYSLAGFGGIQVTAGNYADVRCTATLYGADNALPNVDDILTWITPEIPGGMDYVVKKVEQGEDGHAATSRSIRQEYKTLSGQSRDLYFITPEVMAIMINVYIDSNPVSTIKTRIEDTLIGMNSAYGIGENITDLDILSKIKEMGFDFNVIGARISMGMIPETWDVSSNIKAGAILSIARENIIVLEWKANDTK